MKRSIIFIVLLMIVLIFCETWDIRNTSAEDIPIIMNKYTEAVNNQDVESYLELFVDYQKKMMKDYLKCNSTKSFFNNEEIRVLKCKEISLDSARLCTDLSSDNLKAYKDVRCYYAHLQNKNIDCSEWRDSFFVVITGEEYDKQRIIRLSEADINEAEREGFSFNIVEETVAKKKQNELVDKTAYINKAGKSISQPSVITVYFTNGINTSHYKNYKATISFDSYIRNVLPNEFITSYYSSYAAYKKSTAMAAKMYGWYNKIHSKWNFAPYYSDVMDNTNDQIYIYGTENKYSKDAWNSITNKALVDSSGVVFQTQYLANSGEKGSGILNATKALSKAQNGESYTSILKFYYNNSSNANNKTVKIVSY